MVSTSNPVVFCSLPVILARIMIFQCYGTLAQDSTTKMLSFNILTFQPLTTAHQLTKQSCAVIGWSIRRRMKFSLCGCVLSGSTQTGRKPNGLASINKWADLCCERLLNSILVWIKILTHLVKAERFLKVSSPCLSLNIFLLIFQDIL